MTDFDEFVTRQNKLWGTKLRRTVCGKPHRLRSTAERGMRSAKTWGWSDVQIEDRGQYFVVTGYNTGKGSPDALDGVSMPSLQGRYRWPGK